LRNSAQIGRHPHIYNIKKGANGEPVITAAWSSPDPTQYDSHWTLAAWDIEHSKVKVKHYFQKYERSNPTHDWENRWLTIPLR